MHSRTGLDRCENTTAVTLRNNHMKKNVKNARYPRPYRIFAPKQQASKPVLLFLYTIHCTMLTSTELIDELHQLVVGLLYPSETDAPIEVFFWSTSEKGAISDDNIAFELHHPEDVHIADSPAEEFFEGVTDTYEWHTPDEVEATQQFVKLRDTLFANITKPRQLWIGETKVDLVLYGRTTDGNYIGLKTHIVET